MDHPPGATDSGHNNRRQEQSPGFGLGTFSSGGPEAIEAEKVETKWSKHQAGSRYEQLAKLWRQFTLRPFDDVKVKFPVQLWAAQVFAQTSYSLTQFGAAPGGKRAQKASNLFDVSLSEYHLLAVDH